MKYLNRVLVVCSLVMLPIVSHSAPTEPIQVEHWPFDVPCDALQKNGEKWKQTKDLMVGNLLLSDNSFTHTGETRVWDQKCLPNETH
jgi:hypothetical protein